MKNMEIAFDRTWGTEKKDFLIENYYEMTMPNIDTLLGKYQSKLRFVKKSIRRTRVKKEGLAPRHFESCAPDTFPIWEPVLFSPEQIGGQFQN